MEVFGVGLPEMLMIAVVALVVVGPERLPGAARTIGKGIADFRRAIEPARSVWRDISEEINNVTTTTATAITPSLTKFGSNTNPFPAHPVLETMTQEEQESFTSGGEMPPHVAAQLASQVGAPSNGHVPGQAVELPHIDYSMPHSEMIYEPAPPFTEDLYYPAPGENNTTMTNSPNGNTNGDSSHAADTAGD